MRFFEDEDPSELSLRKDLFGETPRGKPSVEIKIIFDYAPFYEECSWAESQPRLPMKIDIFIPELKAYLWDLEYRFFCKFFMENIAEAPRTVVAPQQAYDVHCYDVWQLMELRLGKAMFRFFQGKRSDLDVYLRKNDKRMRNSDKYVLGRNAASLALLKVKNVVYQMCMSENGAKNMRVYVGTLKMTDFR
jgi:hypothetical protein